MVELYSFDIFDTLITRKVAKPVGIFALMQHVINTESEYEDLPSDVKSNFYKYRTNIEFRQHKFNNNWNDKKDVTLEQIYQDLKITYFLTDVQCDKLKKLEIKLELDNVVAIKENIDKVKQLLNNGKKVILISDMYLPEDVIKQMLFKCDEVLSTLKLYVSSKYGVMKSTGEMYKLIQKEEKADYTKWYHLGDNKKSDYEQALALGIKAKLYKYVDLKKYETALLNKNIENPLSHILVGSSKNIRLSHNGTPLFNLGASLGGSILYPYISWVLEQSIKNEIKTLYFIARDGYVLKKMADTIIELNNINIKTKYLYSSRKAWRTPSLTLENVSHYQQFIEAIGTNGYDKLEEIFEISKKELTKFIPSKYLKLKNKLKVEDKKSLKELLKENKNLLNYLVEKNKEKRFATVSYLKQNIDFTESIAFVDSNGSGYTQNCLCELAKEFLQKPTLSFFITTTAPADSHPLLIKKYFYNFRKPLMSLPLELLVKAPHGQTIGYKEENGVWLPELEKHPFMLTDDYVKGLLEYTKLINSIEKEYEKFCFQDQTILSSYTNFIHSKVDSETANLLGGIGHSFAGAETKEFAPKISLLSAIRYLLTGKIDTESLLYSSMRSTETVRKIINLRNCKV